MSQQAIRSALETAVSLMSPSIATAWENVEFEQPLPTVPYQKVHLKFASPDNSEWGSSHTEIGYMQVSLMYPRFLGVGDSTSRGQLLRDQFKRGRSFSNSGVTVNITHTPEISAGAVDGDRFNTPVKIRFSAYIP